MIILRGGVIRTAVIEYELVKKILYIAGPLLIILTIVLYIRDLDYIAPVPHIVINHGVKCLSAPPTLYRLGWAPFHSITQGAQAYAGDFSSLHILGLVVIAHLP